MGKVKIKHGLVSWVPDSAAANRMELFGRVYGELSSFDGGNQHIGFSYFSFAEHD